MAIRTVILLMLLAFVAGGWLFKTYDSSTSNGKPIKNLFDRNEVYRSKVKRYGVNSYNGSSNENSNESAQSIQGSQIEQSHQKKCYKQRIACDVFEWIKTADYERLFNWYLQIENPADDQWKTIRIALLDNIQQQSDSINIKLIRYYLQLETVSPFAQYITALANREQGAYQPALETLFVLSSYYQDEVSDMLIQARIEEFSNEYTSTLFANQQWSFLIDAVDYLIQRRGDNAEFYLTKARAQQALNQQYAALETLRNLEENSPESMTEIGAIAEEVVTSIKENSESRFELQSYGQQFLIPIIINGQTLPMLLDTGASISTINPDVASDIGLDRSNKSIQLATAGGLVRSQLLESDSFGLQGYERDNMTLAQVELSSSLPAVGLLGMDYLAQFQFYIDQNNNYFYLSPNDK